MSMRLKLTLEETVLFAADIYVFTMLPFAWWWFPLLILAPDISILGYVINSRAGAAVYNFFHHKGIAVIVFVSGWIWSIPGLQLIGLILFAHSCLDRMLGLGLKYPDHFQHTHLGWFNEESESL